MKSYLKHHTVAYLSWKKTLHLETRTPSSKFNGTMEGSRPVLVTTLELACYIGSQVN